MSDVNRKIFAELAGLSSGNLSNYIKRGKIIPNDDGTIDTEFELNKIFLENRKKLKEEKDNPKPKEEVIQDLPFLEEVMEEVEIESVPELNPEPILEPQVFPQKKEKKPSKLLLPVKEKVAATPPVEIILNGEKVNAKELALRKQVADVLKVERDAEKKKLEIEKLQGKLMPIELVEQILSINLNTVFKEFEASIFSQVQMFIPSNDREEIATATEKIRYSLADVIEKAREESADQIEAIINDYSQARRMN